MSNSKEPEIQIDEARWKAWEERGRIKNAASARKMQTVAWVIVVLLISWAYFTLSR